MKKVLSFVLSVAMVICLMPAMAFAADDAAATTTATATGLSQFSDADSIKNKEAVAVLVGLGIVDGMGDGTFQPAGNLTRAQASKLVATLVKSGDKSDIPAPAADPFTDVAKSYWGAGSIKFGVDNGYINGMGDGTFHPEDQVTTAQLATMLDKLLGYSVADINYQWPENAMAKATIAGLLKSVTKGASDSLNREEAAQMIFNALEANTKVKSTTTGSDSSLVDGGSNYENVPNKLTDDYRNPAKDSVEQLVEKYFPKATLDKNNAADKFGRTSSVWKVGKDKVTDEVVDAPAYTYTDLQTKDSLKSDLDGLDLSDIEVIRNNVSAVYPSEDEVVETYDEDGNVTGKETIPGNAKLNLQKIANMTGNGTLVEVYTNDKGSAIDKIIIVDYAPAKVNSVNSQDESLQISTEGTNTVQYEIKKDGDKEVYEKVSSVAKKDKILVAVGPDKTGDIKVLDAYIPEKVDGTLTKFTDRKYKDNIKTRDNLTAESEYVVAGKTYKAATTNAIETDLSTKINKDVEVYLDEYGFIKINDKVESKRDNYILIKKVYTKDGQYGETTTYVFGVTEDGEVIGDLKCADDTQVANANSYVGKLAPYRETAKGYEFESKDEGKTETNDSYKAAIKSNPSRIDGKLISKSVKTVNVTGTKPSEVKASVTTGTPVVAENSKTVHYVAVEGEITTIFVEGSTASNEILYVPADAWIRYESYTSDESGSTGTASVIDCYRANVQEPEEILVTGESTEHPEGFYSSMEAVGKTEDGTVVYEIKPYTGTDPTEDVKLVNTESIIKEAGSNGLIVLDSGDYMVKDDVAVRDLTTNQKDTGVAKITSVEELIDAVNEKTASEATAYEISVKLAYEINATTGNKEVKQLYVTNIRVLNTL